MKKIIIKLLKAVMSLVVKLPWVWELLTINQLRYKFSALKAGLKLNKTDTMSLFNFRRNVHRIEKGLSYSDTRSVFATDYIGVTVNALRLAKETRGFDEDTVKWGESVLRKYFDSVGSDPSIDRAKEVFNNLTLEFPSATWYPYPNDERANSTVTYDELLQLSMRRRSVRYFENRKVDEEIVQKALDVARLSPSACNRQSFGYLFYNDPDISAKIADVPGGVKGYDLKNIIVVYGTYKGYFNVRDINAPVIDASLASMALLFALETLGVGTVCINWPNLPDREYKIRKLISLSDDEFVIMMIGLGYPTRKGKIPYSGKRPVHTLLQTNKRTIK